MSLSFPPAFGLEFRCQISCSNIDLFIEDNLGLSKRRYIYIYIFFKISHVMYNEFDTWVCNT